MNNFSLPKLIEQDQQKELVHMAKLITEKKIDVIEGLRVLRQLIIKIKLDKEPFLLPIIGIESQTDHFPSGKVRDKYSVEVLKTLDKEKQEYINEFESQIIKVCEEIITKYSNEDMAHDTEKKRVNSKKQFLKRSYKSDYQQLKEIIDTYDPISLLAIGAPKDEYDPEINRILPKLARCLSKDEVHEVYGVYLNKCLGNGQQEDTTFILR